jgi:exopolysaccharide production protein ExoZ
MTRAADTSKASTAPTLIPGSNGIASSEIYAGIQCLRFVAALMVVVRHATYYTSERLSSEMAVWTNGGAGVDVFFIISGFVMMITAGKFERRSGGWADFALRRLVRVVPLYWLATTVKLATMLLMPAVVLHATLDWGYVAKSYLFVPAYADDGTIAPLMGVGWTLLFEMFFYAVFTLALALRVNLLAFCGGVLLLCAAGSLVKPDPFPAYMMYLDPLVLEFLIGMAFARWATGARLNLVTCIGLCAVGFAIIFAFPDASFDNAGLLRAIGPALVVLGVISIERHVRSFPRPLVFLGAASYSLYMMHPLIAPLGPALLRRAGLVWPIPSVLLSIALALLTALIIFMLFEQPVTNRLVRLLRLRERRGLFVDRANDR